MSDQAPTNLDKLTTAPFRVVADDKFQAALDARAALKDEGFQQQIDNRLRTIDLFQALRPDLTRDEIVDNLPTLYQSLTGDKHIDGVGPVERAIQVVDQTLKSAKADEIFWADQRSADMTRSFGAAAEFFGMGGPVRQVTEQMKVNRVENEKSATERVKALDAAIAKTQVDHGGAWWLLIVDNATTLATSVGQIAPEAAAGAIVAGPVGGALGAWDASSKLMAGSSYRTMRQRGVDHQNADSVATLFGYAAGAVDVLELGTVGAIALKPIVKKATMAALPALARALLNTGAKVGAATATGTIEEVIQEGILIAGENTGYQKQNDRYTAAIDAINKARPALEASIQAGIEEYNSRSLIPLDNPQEIARRLLDTATQSATGLLVLGGLGGVAATPSALKTIKAWDKEGVVNQKIAAVVADLKTEHAVQTAEPVEAPADLKTSVVDATGAPVTVYHAADQGLAGGRGDLAKYGSGVRFFTSREDAELAARGMSTGPLDPTALVEAIRKGAYPQALGDAVAAVVKGGREAAGPYEAELRTWNEQNPGTDYHQVLDLALSINTGEPLADRNEIVRAYGLEAALPAGGIIEAKIQADKAVRVEHEHQIDQAFKDGAQAVEWAGVWHVNDAQHVVVTAKTDSVAEARVKNPAGALSFQANENTLRALTGSGEEAGRVRLDSDATTVRVSELTTVEKFRRQGVARALVQRIMDQHAGKTIDWGTVTTPEGRAFRDSVRRSLPTWDAWGSRIADAEMRGEAVLAEFLRQKVDTIPSPGDLLENSTPLNRDQLRKILSKGMTIEEADASLAILERMSWAGGRPLDDLLGRAIEGVQWVESVKDGSGTVRQKANGAAILGAGGKRLIQLVQGRANVTTVLHEVFHVLRPLLDPREQAALLAWTGQSEWNTAAEERAARGFEQYLGEGRPTGDPEVDGILAKLASWFRLIYDALFNDPAFTVDGKPVVLSAEARQVYDRIVQGRRGPPGQGFSLTLPPDWVEPMFQDDTVETTSEKTTTLFQEEDLAPTEYEVKRLAKELEFFKGGTFTLPINIGRTPAILRSFGAPDLPMVIPPSKLKVAMGPDGVDGGHGITFDQVRQLQLDMFDPAFVIVSRSDPTRILVVTNATDAKGRPILAVIQRDGQIQQHRANVITSVYGRQGAKGFFQEEIDRGGVIYRGNEKDGVSYVFGLNWPKNGLLPSGESMMTRERAVKGETAVLFQEDTAPLEKMVADKVARLKEFETSRESYLESRSQGKSAEDKATMKIVLDEYITNLRAEIEADNQAIENYRANRDKLDGRRQAIKAAVEARRPVPDAWIEAYQSEPWARTELDRRADLRDQLEHARNFDDVEQFLESILEGRLLEILGNPDHYSKEHIRTVRSGVYLTPEEHEQFVQVYGIAHAKTPEALDREFAQTLTPAKVKRILAGMAQGGYIADKNLPQHVTAQVTKSMEGGETNEAEIPRILTTMKNDPRTYRRIAQQGFPDQAELEALALEQDIEKATAQQAADDAPPVIAPIEIPTDLNIDDKVAIRMGTKSRAEWQRKALDAEKEHDNLERAMTLLERLSDRWTEKAETVQTGESELADLEALAVLGQQQFTKLRAQLAEFAKEAGGDRTQTKDRVVVLVSDLTKHIRGLAASKEAARRAYAAQAEEMRKMGAYLAKPAPKTIAVDEARLIDLKRAMIDPHFRSLKKSELLELEAEWYKAHPDAIVPKSRRGELFGKNLNLWTYDELHAAFVERKEIEDRGRAKMIARRLETENRRYGVRQQILDALFSKGAQLQAKIKEAEAAGDTLARQRYAAKYLEWETDRAKKLRNINQDKAALANFGGQSYFLTMSNLADSLDGMADFKGINHKMLWSEVNTVENAYLKETDRRKTKMLKWIKDQGINLSRLNDRVKIEGEEVPFTLDGLLTLYVGQKNERKAMALQFGNRISLDAYRYVNYRPELEWLRKLGDRIIQEYDENKDRLFDVAAEYDNIDLRSQMEEAYTPMARSEVNMEGLDEQLQWEAGVASAVRAANIEKGFTKARIDVGKEHQKPIKLGEFAQWLEMVGRQEQYIAYTPIVKDLKALYTTGDVKDTLVQVHGKKVWVQVDNYIKSLANRYYDKAFTPLDRIISKLSGHAALAYMAYNLGTVLKQLSSLPLFIAHTRTDFLLASLAKMANPIALIRRVDSLSIQMKTRVGYAELDVLRVGGNPAGGGKSELVTAVKKGLNTVENIVQKAADPGIKPMQWVDKLVAAAGWDASFETAKARGLTEEAAVEYADWVVGKTQQSSHAKDTAGVMRDNSSLAKAMTLFAGPAVKVYNEVVYGTRANLKNGHGLKSLGTLFGVSAASIVFYAIGKGAPPEGEEWYEWVFLGLLNQVPVVGGAASSILQGYDAGNIILNQAIESAVKTGQSLNRALDESQSEDVRNRAAGKAGTGLLDLVGLGFGVPVTPGKRIWKAFETGNPGELVGWHAQKD